MLVLTFALVAVGCGSSGSSSSSSPSATVAPTSGGVLKVGLQPGNGIYDPIAVSSTADIFLISQVLQNLVIQKADFTLAPVLATKWDSTDGKTWTWSCSPT